MKTTQRRGLLGLLAALPLAAAAPAVLPAASRLRHGESLLVELGGIHIPLQPAEDILPGWMPGKPQKPVQAARPELAPPGWDTLENVR